MAPAGGTWQSQPAPRERGSLSIRRASLSYCVFPDGRRFMLVCVWSVRLGGPWPCTDLLVHSTNVNAAPDAAMPDGRAVPRVVAAATLRFNRRLQTLPVP